MQKKFRLAIILTFICLACAVCLSACKKEFKVVFDANGGEHLSGKEVQIVTSAEDIVPPVYTRNGYEFSSWDTAIRNIDKDTTVKALWEAKEYTVNLDVGEYGVPLAISTLNVTYNSPVSGLPTPESANEDYIFAGWVIDGSSKTIIEGQIWQEYAENVTLKATWFATTGFKITYENMQGTYFVGGEGNPIVYGKKLGVFTLKNPLKDGVVFIGWSGTDIEGISREVVIDATDINNLKDRTYQAVFSSPDDVYTLNFQLWSIVKNEKVYIKINGSTANFSNCVLKGEKFDAETWQYVQIPEKPFIGRDNDQYKCKGYYAFDKDGNKVNIDENTVFSQEVFGTDKDISIYVEITSTYSDNYS